MKAKLKPLLTEGRNIVVYKDPMTMRNPEGEVILIREVEPMGPTWEVEFIWCPPEEFLARGVRIVSERIVSWDDPLDLILLKSTSRSAPVWHRHFEFPEDDGGEFLLKFARFGGTVDSKAGCQDTGWWTEVHKVMSPRDMVSCISWWESDIHEGETDLGVRRREVVSMLNHWGYRIPH